MSERPTTDAATLLDEVLAAHGGLGRWRTVTALTAHGRFGGLLRSRFPGNRMAYLSVRVQLAHLHAVFDGFPHADQQPVFDRGDVRIETRDGDLISARTNARSAFAGLSGLRRNLRWDALDAAYFAGYAFWNYLSIPLLLARDGVAITEGDNWLEAGERWRRLEVTFPPDVHTHSRHQTFYIDDAGLIRRHDYVAHPIGRWAHAAHYCNDHQRFTGLVFPTHRRVRPRRPAGRTLPHPILVALDIDHIEIEI
ncbi:hypothetical protein [Nocardia vaccinii]|uniref:hypothetical protein n=1 Tax=Nocardia vaccinii TaxID=1822 RepID=UPI00082A2992|nr:hypothetical protein [Nocardia vaccinii]